MSRNPLEDKEQIAVIKWAKRHEKDFPGLHWIHAITNENAEGPGKGAYRKSMGVKSGVSDLCLPYPRGVFHGLYIEMKRRKGGKVSPKQKEWRAYCLEVGYQSVICKGAKEAMEMILEYYE